MYLPRPLGVGVGVGNVQSSNTECWARPAHTHTHTQQSNIATTYIRHTTHLYVSSVSLCNKVVAGIFISNPNIWRVNVSPACRVGITGVQLTPGH